MGFIMDGLDAEAYDRQYKDSQLVARILKYFKPHLSTMSMIALMIVLNSLMDAAFPFLIARGLDRLEGASNLSTTIWERTAWLIAAIFFSGVLSWSFNFFRQKYTARTVGDVVLKLRQDAFDAVLARDMSFYDEYSSGKIVSRVTSDTQDFSNVVTLTLNLMSQVLIVMIVVTLLLFINARLAGVAIAIAPLVIFIALAFRRIARYTTRQARRVLAEVNANVQESIAGISIAKNFRQEPRIYEEFKPVNAQTYRLSLRQGLTFSSIFPILGTVSGLGTALIVYTGGMSVIRGTLSAGNLYLFIESINLFWFPLISIASFWSQFQLGLAASERVFALIDVEPRVVQTGDRRVQRLQGHIEFRNLDFRYTPTEKVLENFDLTIAAGETLALVGHTGAGKSSIGKLVARFYEFQGGELLIDGKDVRSFNLDSYRRQLGIVPQTPFLFAGTVADNIRYGKPEATDDDVAAAASHVGGGDWLKSLPQSLETSVGEEGKGISMGQRQLVALARVLLQDPAILILDEATASVDPLTEAQIQEGLDTLLQNRTAIVIAHRLSTIKAADRIIVLRQGQILEEGHHKALMAGRGHYAELYDTYFRHQSLEYIESWRNDSLYFSAQD
jgi:ABC-type multidrug transport system fused ATPase/permease subunit